MMGELRKQQNFGVLRYFGLDFSFFQFRISFIILGKLLNVFVRGLSDGYVVWEIVWSVKIFLYRFYDVSLVFIGDFIVF